MLARCGKWNHSDSEFRGVNKHVTCFSPTTRWLGLRGHLVPTRQRHTLQEHRRLFEEILLIAPRAIRSRRLALPIWPLVIFFYGVFLNPVFIWTVQGSYKTWISTSKEKLPIAPAMLARVMTTPEIGLLSVGRTRDVTYPIWSSKLYKTKLYVCAYIIKKQMNIFWFIPSWVLLSFEKRNSGYTYFFCPPLYG